MRAVPNSNIINVLLNRSKKPKPANWRELLRSSVRAWCERPRPDWFGDTVPETLRVIPVPIIVIPSESSPSMITFVLSLDQQVYYLQRRAIDWALMLSDTQRWQIPKVKVRRGVGKETFLTTNLRLIDGEEGARHSFDPALLQGVPGINWRHIVTFKARDRHAPYLSIKTRCGTNCECRQNLPDLWHLGWEMHY